MQRTQMALIGALLVGAVGVFAWRAKQHSRAAEEPHSPLPVASAAASATEQPTTPSASPSVAAPAYSTLLPDGRQIPELPADAPKAVNFGVVLLTYRGAETAPSDARTKEAALAKAKELLPAARENFGEAVKKGDRGSTAQAGSMPRGVLEPGIEYVLFTLKKGEVYGEPIDTPRGYWILRRSE
jgi:hypothetical protein